MIQTAEKAAPFSSLASVMLPSAPARVAMNAAQQPRPCLRCRPLKNPVIPLRGKRGLQAKAKDAPGIRGGR